MSASSALLRRSLRLRFSSATSTLFPVYGCSNGRYFSSSALAPSSSPLAPSSPLLLRGAIPHGPKKPSSLALAPLRFASSKVLVDKKASAEKLSAEEKLSRVLDSEIECALESDTQGQELDKPHNFPFEIIDNPGDQAITLKRDYNGENIQAAVFLNIDEQDLEEGDDGDSNDEKNEGSMEATVSLVVTIDKGEGPLLEFNCTLGSEELQIESMQLKKRDDANNNDAYQGPEFSDLDENLQKALYKYLQVRGIKKSLFDFLHEYMLNKDEREYLVWLKNMKQFVG